MEAGFDQIAGAPGFWTAGGFREDDLGAAGGSTRTSIGRSSVGTKLARTGIAPSRR